MKLSIITVNLNNAAGLEKTAESIVGQTFKDFEWIVIDGGSSDGSVDVIRKYADCITYWVSEKDSGIYNAMNKGVRHANGTYVQFLNSGDWLADENVTDDFNKVKCEGSVIYGDLRLMKADRCVCARKIGVLSFEYMMYSSIGHSASFIRRELLNCCPYNEDLKIVSDWEFWLKMILQGEKFQYVERFISCFDLGGISQTNQMLNDIERQSVIDRLIPESILYDYKAQHIGQLAELRRKHPIFSKYITFCTVVMKKMDKLFCHRTY